MSLLREKRFKTLLDLALEAEKRGHRAFAQYCRLRDEGLRPQAFAELERFVAQMEKEPFPARRAFAGWLFAFSFYNPQVLEACPVLLRANVVAPAIEEWIRTEPENPQALRWSQDERAVLVAVRLAPHDEIAVGRFATITLARIEYAAYELPQTYLGEEPRQDLLDLEAVLALLEACGGEALEELREEALVLKTKVRAYLSGGETSRRP